MCGWSHGPVNMVGGGELIWNQKHSSLTAHLLLQVGRRQQQRQDTHRKAADSFRNSVYVHFLYFILFSETNESFAPCLSCHLWRQCPARCLDIVGTFDLSHNMGFMTTLTMFEALHLTAFFLLWNMLNFVWLANKTTVHRLCETFTPIDRQWKYSASSSSFLNTLLLSV